MEPHLILLLASLGAYFGPEPGEAVANPDAAQRPAAPEEEAPAPVAEAPPAEPAPQPEATTQPEPEPVALPPATAPPVSEPLAEDMQVGKDLKDHDFGPFYEAEPVTEVKHATQPREQYPRFSVGQGAFCFVEDAMCKSSLLASGDVGAGLNVIAGDGGFDVPLTQYRVLGGLTVRPFYMARKKWHPWALGATFDWARASGPVAAGETDDAGNVLANEDRRSIRAIHIGVVNQIWLSQKKHAFHVDIKLGAVQSSVLNFPGPAGCKNENGRCYWGTMAEVGFGFGGWGSVYVGADFLDQDTRVLVGFRIHGIAAGPAAGLVAAGYAAGGGFSGGNP